MSNKSRLVDLLLCWFLGCFGVHRFYEGKMGTGLIWLFTGGLCGLGAVIDWFLILFGKATDKAGNKITKW